MRYKLFLVTLTLPSGLQEITKTSAWSASLAAMDVYIVSTLPEGSILVVEEARS